ncbi:CLUMA_CG000922, isoform A [Clunio marinus]|uniref:CLUMA_CG000922, isoform A n=1 Tax=Clunio marinus TaxID=568069 RepID=A0A1J1HI79_9DIPT|nr:CLUMA_CG000922, isoform A [Clunio marinus]
MNEKLCKPDLTAYCLVRRFRCIVALSLTALAVANSIQFDLKNIYQNYALREKGKVSLTGLRLWIKKIRAH